MITGILISDRVISWEALDVEGMLTSELLRSLLALGGVSADSLRLFSEVSVLAVSVSDVSMVSTSPDSSAGVSFEFA